MASSSSTDSDDLERLRNPKHYLQKQMVPDWSDLALRPIRTKPENKPRPSSEYYPESPVVVPFHWESQPGTPKLGSGDSFIAPPAPSPTSFQVPSSPYNPTPRAQIRQFISTFAYDGSKDYKSPSSIFSFSIRRRSKASSCNCCCSIFCFRIRRRSKASSCSCCYSMR